MPLAVYGYFDHAGRVWTPGELAPTHELEPYNIKILTERGVLRDMSDEQCAGLLAQAKVGKARDAHKMAMRNLERIEREQLDASKRLKAIEKESAALLSKLEELSALADKHLSEVAELESEHPDLEAAPPVLAKPKEAKPEPTRAERKAELLSMTWMALFDRVIEPLRADGLDEQQAWAKAKDEGLDQLDKEALAEALLGPEGEPSEETVNLPEDGDEPEADAGNSGTEGEQTGGAEPSGDSADLHGMTVPDLKRLAESLGLTIASRATKAEIIEALEQATG